MLASEAAILASPSSVTVCCSNKLNSMGDDSSDSGYGDCGYCGRELNSPYWMCPICDSFNCCRECFFGLNPKPDKPPHYAEHGLNIFLGSSAPSDDTDVTTHQEAVVQQVSEATIEHNPPSDDDLNSNVEESDALSSAHSSTVSSCSSDEDSTSETVDNLSV